MTPRPCGAPGAGHSCRVGAGGTGGGRRVPKAPWRAARPPLGAAVDGRTCRTAQPLPESPRACQTRVRMRPHPASPPWLPRAPHWLGRDSPPRPAAPPDRSPSRPLPLSWAGRFARSARLPDSGLGAPRQIRPQVRANARPRTRWAGALCSALLVWGGCRVARRSGSPWAAAQRNPYTCDRRRIAVAPLIAADALAGPAASGGRASGQISRLLHIAAPRHPGGAGCAACRGPPGCCRPARVRNSAASASNPRPPRRFRPAERRACIRRRIPCTK